MSDYLSPDEAAEMLSVDPKTVRRWANAGRLPCSRTVGGHRRFRREDVMALLGIEETTDVFVYRLYRDSDGRLIYVGVSGDLATRIRDHRRSRWYVPGRIVIEGPMGRDEALKVERDAIEIECPLVNGA